MLTGSLEFIQPLYDDVIYGAVFIDTGNVWPGSWGYDLEQLNTGAGFGIRIKLPMGAFSIDWAKPVDRFWPHLPASSEIHFNLGTVF